jgi:hypothetical protein
MLAQDAAGCISHDQHSQNLIKIQSPNQISQYLGQHPGASAPGPSQSLFAPQQTPIYNQGQNVGHRQLGAQNPGAMVLQPQLKQLPLTQMENLQGPAGQHSLLGHQLQAKGPYKFGQMHKPLMLQNQQINSQAEQQFQEVFNARIQGSHLPQSQPQKYK